MNISIVHKISILYKNLYKLSHKISKRDKFGIFLKVESACLTSLTLAIKAALSNKTEKSRIILELRVVIELLKQLIRTMFELEIISQDKYLETEKDLREISQMSAGWLKYAQQ